VQLEVPSTRKGPNEEEPAVVTAPVYRFDIRHQIQDLMRDDLFFDINNLVVNRNKPFDDFVPEDGMIDEIHSGEWYSRTYDDIMNNKAKNPAETVVLPLKLYCDKTGLDPMMQRHALEPIMFTLTILTRDVQQNCEKAWRHLGFIPDLDKIIGADKSTSNDPFHRGRSVRNYHKCLDFVFEELIKLQEDGMTVYLQIGDHSIKRGGNKYNLIWFIKTI
jgi:hypothetical protein